MKAVPINKMFDALHIGGEFEPIDQADRSHEVIAVQEFARALEAKYGICLTDVELREPPAPDCIASHRGQRIGIELTRLLSPGVLAKRRMAARGKCHYPYSIEINETQWIEKTFRDRVNERLDAKAARYKHRVDIDILLIATTERWLYPRDVNIWMNTLPFVPRPQIRAAFIMLQHNPSYACHRPIFKLYGEFAGGEAGAVRTAT